MAKIIGTLPEGRRPSLITTATAWMSETGRTRAEMESGEGLKRLHGVVESLPENVTAVIRPSLGFMMKVDCCVIGPGAILVINALHWKGKIRAGEKGKWAGAGGVDLGRPDRTSQIFCDRLRFSELARGFRVEPVVIFTAGLVDFQGPELEAILVQWEKALSYLQERLPPPGTLGFDASDLIRAISP